MMTRHDLSHLICSSLLLVLLFLLSRLVRRSAKASAEQDIITQQCSNSSPVTVQPTYRHQPLSRVTFPRLFLGHAPRAHSIARARIISGKPVTNSGELTVRTEVRISVRKVLSSMVKLETLVSWVMSMSYELLWICNSNIVLLLTTAEKMHSGQCKAVWTAMVVVVTTILSPPVVRAGVPVYCSAGPGTCSLNTTGCREHAFSPVC